MKYKNDFINTFGEFDKRYLKIKSMIMNLYEVFYTTFDQRFPTLTEIFPVDETLSNFSRLGWFCFSGIVFMKQIVWVLSAVHIGPMKFQEFLCFLYQHKKGSKTKKVVFFLPFFTLMKKRSDSRCFPKIVETIFTKIPNWIRH